MLAHSEMRGIDHADKRPVFTQSPHSPCFSKGSSYAQALRVGSQWDRVYRKQCMSVSAGPGSGSPWYVKSKDFQPNPLHSSHVAQPCFSLEQEKPSDLTGRRVNQNVPKTGKRERVTEEEFQLSKVSGPAQLLALPPTRPSLWIM